MYKCQECGKKFKTTKAAQKASNDGCPKCGGCDIDIDVEIKQEQQAPPKQQWPSPKGPIHPSHY